MNAWLHKPIPKDDSYVRIKVGTPIWDKDSDEVQM